MGILDGLLGHGSAVDADKLAARLNGVLLDDETPQLAFKVIRDFFVFTQKRLILVSTLTATQVSTSSVPATWRQPISRRISARRGQVTPLFIRFMKLGVWSAAVAALLPIYH